MPDPLDSPTPRATPGDSAGSQARVDHIPTHQHLDTDALSAFLDDRLEGDLSLAAAGHIATCSDCRRELAELRETVSLLNGLPQYRPRRSFALGPEFAHPVRTSRFARFLPFLPRLQAATVACLLLLLLVGAGDVLTQIGEDSDNSASFSSEPEQTGGVTAFEPGEAAGGDGQPVPGSTTGDGTGGETGNAGFGAASESAPDSNATTGEQPNQPAPEEASLDDEAVASFSETAPQDESDSDSAPIMSAAAPANARSASQDDSVGESSDNADDADAAGDEAAAISETAEEDAAGSAAGGGQGSAALPAPTIGITTEADADPSDAAAAQDVALADASDASQPGRRSSSASDPGISNWRLIEIVLAVLLVVLGSLVVVLHRLNKRARRIGIIR